MSETAQRLSEVNFESSELFATLESAADDPLLYDGLGFGLVGMQHDGTVVAYNQIEAKFSGIPATRVLERNFFVDVAPCTNNYMVSGRFESEPELDMTIDYVFTLKMRPTRVQLRLLRSESSPRQYLAIRRRA